MIQIPAQILQPQVPILQPQVPIDYLPVSRIYIHVTCRHTPSRECVFELQYALPFGTLLGEVPSNMQASVRVCVGRVAPCLWGYCAFLGAEVPGIFGPKLPAKTPLTFGAMLGPARMEERERERVAYADLSPHA